MRINFNHHHYIQQCDSGYAMATLLVSLSVMSIVMSMALPVWSHTAKREREAELVFRGQQYARAVELYQRKFAGAFPKDFQTLVEQRFLRRLYRDPMTEDGVFQPVFETELVSPQGIRANNAETDQPTDGVPFGNSGEMSQRQLDKSAGVKGGVVGVISKSTDKSIMLYNGRSTYNEWTFIHIQSESTSGTLQGGVSDKPARSSDSGAADVILRSEKDQLESFRRGT